MVEVHRRQFFIWEHGEGFLEKFFNKLNSFHPTITFTAEYSKETSRGWSGRGRGDHYRIVC